MRTARQASDGLFWLLIFLLCLPPALIPNSNRDIFWHLSSARWIWTHHGLPTRDFLSWTKAGAPWVDFEWLWDLGAGAFYRGWGLPGLMVLKCLLIAANAWAFLRLLVCRRVAGLWICAALVLWSAQMLPHCGLQPDLFSLFCFTTTLCLLESRFQRPCWSDAALTLLLFAVWAQAHADFAAGLALFLCYALAEAWAQNRHAAIAKILGLGAAVMGSLCNPYGLGPYRVLLLHGESLPAMTRFVREWGALPLRNPLFWPFWAALAILIALAAAAAIRKIPAQKIPWGLVLAAAPLAVLSIRHARFSSYFNVPATLLCAVLVENLFASRPEAQKRRAVLFVFAVYGAFLLGVLPRVAKATAFNDPNLPIGAARFMAAERPILEPLHFYHPWEWGGYLGWRLRPWFKDFGDGRYLFHEQHMREQEAFASPQSWQRYLRAQGADAALLPNVRILLGSRRRYPNGTTRFFRRPYFVFYMPRSRWALVYWTSRWLIFVDRTRAPKAWLAAHEYRYLHPGDEAAFQDALRRGEINPGVLRKEKARHAEELRANF